jgi:CHAT domain-containing protein/tetratricopeptide (TPR) repeat protein
VALLFHCIIIFVLTLSSCKSIGTATVQEAPAKPSESSEKLNTIRKQAYQLVVKQDFEGAIEKYKAARELALKENNSKMSVQFLINVAGCYQSISAYQEAMKYYQKAIQEAKLSKLTQLENTTALNMASLLLELGEAQSAADLLKPYPLDGSSMLPDVRLHGFIIQMNIFSKLKRSPDARLAFERASLEAEKQPSAEVSAAYRVQINKWSESAVELRRAYAFAMYAQALMGMDKFDEAEKYSLEAFRLRSTYQDRNRLREVLHLAMIHRSRKDFAGASRLLQLAQNLDPGNRTPMLLFLLDREGARIALAQGNFDDALPKLRSALSKARSWRLEVLPSDSAFLNFEANLSHEIQDAFLGAIARPEFPLAQAGVAVESFWLAEEARFASMRATQFPASEFSNRLPSEYWSTLSRFRRLQAASFSNSPSTLEELSGLESKLKVIEMESGLAIPHTKLNGVPQVEEWTKSLSPHEVVFSYYLAEPYSLAWTATRNGMSVRRIASRKQLSRWIKEFRDEIQHSSQNGNSSTGMELSKQLFGEELYSHRTTPFWTMVLDQELSTLPIAALPAEKAGVRYLVEDHSLRVVPSALFLQTEMNAAWTRQAVGIGDAIYNQADRRLSPMQNASVSQLELNRLPASAKELQISLNTIKNQGWLTVEHTGQSSTVTTLSSTLSQSPDILHLSTHFVPQAGSPHLLNIALSPTKGQTGTSLFSSLDLNAVRTKTKLVVLSGCSSSTGEVISGIGINGLSRAFLISGVSTVLATLWPTEDTEGPIFPVFYQNLIQQKWSPRAAAESLRAAQLQMIRQGGWTSKPSYWAAYLAISKG